MLYLLLINLRIMDVLSLDDCVKVFVSLLKRVYPSKWILSLQSRPILREWCARSKEEVTKYNFLVKMKIAKILPCISSPLNFNISIFSIWVHTVCLYAKIGLKSLQEYSADDINRQHFQMQVFLAF